ncbi:acetoacetate--CoA ligase [Candidiatus Paracoxiella cheracis]|uniref:acetoacetate--CoA ligase n=1 Tax=Candidiatus Paracoxiella cheracis TaxID=3405120 RepID=UPI003BF56E35
MSAIVWEPSSEASSQSSMAAFIQYVNLHHHQQIGSYSRLYQWSIDYPSLFWASIADFCKLITSQPPDGIKVPSNKMQHTQWFTGAKLNFAENLLRRRDEHLAIIFASERGDYRTLTYNQLFSEVTALSNHLRSLGVKSGDRIAGFLPNLPETVIAMLAATSIGAVWSSCSSDFGLQGLLDRFGQIEPTILFAVDGHTYKGKAFHHIEKIKNLQETLPTLKQTIVVPYLNKTPDISSLKNTQLYSDCLNQSTNNFSFEQLPFDHPGYIMYSSGTTGKPKCMVHGAGRTLLQHLKELILHTNLNSKDRIFFNTTCGWMMWNWLVSSLAVGATIVLYEGAPFYPKPTALYDLIDKANINIFGVGAKLIELSAKQNLEPIKTHALSQLRSILTTASPLTPESFDYVYTKIKRDVCLSSISGGSDIISCFALGNPMLPVYRGELQCIGLGMAVKIFNDEGKPVIGEKGELVCTAPFPSMPIYFWNDPNGEKYQHAYFDKYPGIWAHGDYAEITKHGGMIIYGRSDTTLNPGGIRIGTAEIYQQLEKIPEVIEGLAIAQQWENSERIILFVVLKSGLKLNDMIIKTIKDLIRKNTSPHHVPAKIIQVPDLPRTISGKIVELAVKEIIHNQPIKNKEALANPEALDYFRDLEALQ